MEISKFTIGLVFIFLPGILALLVSERLTEHSERKVYEHIVYALVLGCIAHLIYGLLQFAINWAFPSTQLENDRWLDLMLTDKDNVTIQARVVALTAIIGVVLGFLVAYAANHSWLHIAARKLGASKKFADPDVWTYLMNSGSIEWVVIRDLANNLAYLGSVRVFSSIEDPRELVLDDVTVCTNDTGAQLYNLKTAYFSFAKETIVVEIL